MSFRSSAVALASSLLLVVSADAFAQSSMRVHFMNVGQGEATLLEFPCGAILVDTGGESDSEFDSSEALTDYLDQFFEGRPDLGNRLDSLIISHPHIDHTRGAKAVLSRYRPRNAVTDGIETGSGKAGQIAIHRAVAHGEATATPDDAIGFVAVWERDIPPATGLTSKVIDPLDCDAQGNPQIRALWGRVATNPGWPATEFANPNNHSVIIRVDYGQSSILLTGDLEEVAMPALVARYHDSHLLLADVYKVGHHGSANGTTAQLIQEVAPKMAVISMGPPDRETMWTAWAYGHPRQSTVDLLVAGVSGTRADDTVKVAQGIHKFVDMHVAKAIYATGWDGTVVLEGAADGQWKVVRPASVPLPDTAPQLVHLNSASVTELVALPLIGPGRAQAIVAFRDAHGPFTSVDDLTNVPGIGAGTVSAIRHLVTLN